MVTVDERTDGDMVRGTLQHVVDEGLGHEASAQKKDVPANASTWSDQSHTELIASNLIVRVYDGAIQKD